MNLTDVSAAQLRRALEIKQRIESLERELNAVLGGSGGGDTGIGRRAGQGRRRKMSAAARARIAAAQRARWAKTKSRSSNGSPTGAESPRPKRRLSAAGRAAIIAATKARWARVKAGK